MGSCLGIISRRFASYALPFRVVTLALLPPLLLFFSSSLSLLTFPNFSRDDEVFDVGK